MANLWLYLPIELKVRELHGKVLLAIEAAKKNINVIIGPKSEIDRLAKEMSPGFIVNFGLAENFAKSSAIFKKYGHKVVVIDEEGLVTLNDDLYLRYRVSDEALSCSDIVFCWGEHQANLIQKQALGFSSKVFKVGNPRFDVLRKEYRSIYNDDVNRIQNEYGQFILINTNFGRYNHYSGMDYSIESLKQIGWFDNPKDRKFYLGRIDWQKEICNSMIKLLPRLAERFPNHSVVIRPHPSENQEFWIRKVSNIPNVKVVHEGNVIPWLMASDLLIHNNCTTAVEAFVLDKPVIAYRPIIVEEMETALPNSVSQQATSELELLEIADKILNNIVSFGEDKELLKEYVEGLEGETASRRMVEVLLQEPTLFNNIEARGVNSPIHQALDLARQFNRKLNGLGYRKASSSYIKHKMPGLNKKELLTIVSKLNNCLGKDAIDLNISRVKGSCFHIRRRNG